MSERLDLGSISTLEITEYQVIPPDSIDVELYIDGIEPSGEQWGDDLTAVVTENADKIVICPWMGGAEVTLSEAMATYDYPINLTAADEPFLLSVVNSLLVIELLKAEEDQVDMATPEEPVEEVEEPVERVERVELVDPVQPAEPIESVKFMKPVERVETIKLVKRVDVIKPAASVRLITPAIYNNKTQQAEKDIITTKYPLSSLVTKIKPLQTPMNIAIKDATPTALHESDPPIYTPEATTIQPAEHQVVKVFQQGSILDTACIAKIPTVTMLDTYEQALYPTAAIDIVAEQPKAIERPHVSTTIVRRVAESMVEQTHPTEMLSVGLAVPIIEPSTLGHERAPFTEDETPVIPTPEYTDRIGPTKNTPNIIEEISIEQTNYSGLVDVAENSPTEVSRSTSVPETQETKIVKEPIEVTETIDKITELLVTTIQGTEGDILTGEQTQQLHEALVNILDDPDIDSTPEFIRYSLTADFKQRLIEVFEYDSTGNKPDQELVSITTQAAIKKLLIDLSLSKRNKTQIPTIGKFAIELYSIRRSIELMFDITKVKFVFY